MKKDITIFSKDDITDFCIKNGIRSYVSSQVYSWLWNKSCTSFSEMSNVSINDRSIFEKEFFINHIQDDYEEISSDGTIKTKFKLHDGNFVEGVLIPKDKRMTACISSQVGCSLSCSFCATGTLGLTRNLTASEIYRQVVYISRKSMEVYNLPLTNLSLIHI